MAEIDTFSGSVFPQPLRQSLLVDGYANSDHIRAQLMATNRFTTPKDLPDWIRLWKWHEEGCDELRCLLARINSAIENRELREPGKILQVYAALGWYGTYSEECTGNANALRFYSYINELIETRLIRKRSPQGRDREPYGFTWEAGTISYGGYGFKPDRRAKLLVKKLRLAMDEAYERELPGIGSDLTKELRDHPAKFLDHFEYTAQGLNFSEAPILHVCSVNEFAAALLNWHEQDKSIANEIAKTIGKRGAGIRQEFKEEHDWIETLKTELISQAAAKNPLLTAQVRLFIARHMRPD